MFPAEPLPDTIGSYKIVRRLPSTGVAEVYLGRNQGPMGFERECELKLMPDTSDGDVSFAEQLAREAAICAKMNHPAVVRVFDFFEHQGKLVLALEHVEGTTLADLSQHLYDKHQKLGDAAIFYIGARIAGALADAHAAKDDAGQRDADRPQEPEPRERARLRGGGGAAHRLRRRQDPRAHAGHGVRAHQGHAGLHGARAGARRARHHQGRRLRARPPALVAVRRPAATHRRHVATPHLGRAQRPAQGGRRDRRRRARSLPGHAQDHRAGDGAVALQGRALRQGKGRASRSGGAPCAPMPAPRMRSRPRPPRAVASRPRARTRA